MPTRRQGVGFEKDAETPEIWCHSIGSTTRNRPGDASRQSAEVAMKRAGYALLALVVLFAGASLSAHHSFAAAYDTSKQITVQGTLVRVRLTNPHSWFFIDVKDADGK